MSDPVKRNNYLKRVYGITLDEYTDILKEQGGACYGCGGVGKTRALHVDHSHKTGTVRGILCASCNSALRKLKDNPEIAEALADYLRRPPAVRTLGREQPILKPPKRRPRRPRAKR